MNHARQARREDAWDKLAMGKQTKLMNEWNEANPPRPGDDLRRRVAVRLAWCQAELEQRATADGGVP
jgi:hypothetical protein